MRQGNRKPLKVNHGKAGTVIALLALFALGILMVLGGIQALRNTAGSGFGSESAFEAIYALGQQTGADWTGLISPALEAESEPRRAALDKTAERLLAREAGMEGEQPLWRLLYTLYKVDGPKIGAGTRKQLLAEIRDFLACELHLTLNNKTQVFPASHGVDFAGYRHFSGYKLPRKRNVRRARKRFAGLSRCYADGRVDIDTVRCCVASFTGYMRHCKGWKSAESTLNSLILVKNSEKDKE